MNLNEKGAALVDTETNNLTADFAKSFSRSVKQAIRVANGEKLGAGAEEWLVELCKEAEGIRCKRNYL